MKVQLLIASLFFGMLPLFAQPSDAVELKGFLQKKSLASTCLGARQNHYLETTNENIDLDFSKWRSLMDIRAYFKQPVVINGVWRSQDNPTKPSNACKWIEVKEIHFDVDIPEKQKAVHFQELSGYRLLTNDKNPHNDHLVIVSQGDFNRYFAPTNAKTAKIDFDNNFVVAVVRSARKVNAYANPSFLLRERDRVLKFSYDAELGSPSVSEGISTYVIYAVDKVDYKELIFEENNKSVFFTKTHWKDYEQPAKVEKNYDYKEIKSYHIKGSQRKDGHLVFLAQTPTEFAKYFDKTPLKDEKNEINFANEMVVAIGKTSKNREDMNIQDVTIDNRVIKIRYTVQPSNVLMAFPTFSNKVLLMKKTAFDKIIFEENGQQVGEIKREFVEARLTQ